MSVLVQRPHQIPGLISLPRQHAPSPRRAQPPRAAQQSATVQAPVLSPRVSRRQRGQSTAASKDSPAANTRSTKRRSGNNHSHTAALETPASDSSTPASLSISSTTTSGNLPISSSALATVPASQSSVLSASIPSIANSHNSSATTHASPRKANNNSRSAPSTPNPPHSLPVPANRRRARSPRPTAKLPGLPVDEDSNDEATTLGSSPATTPAAKRGRRNNAPGSIPIPPTTGSPSVPTTWQQAALLKMGNTPGLSLVPLVDPVTAAKGGSSTPASPARTTPPSNTTTTLAHSPTMPNFPTPSRRPAHARAPSVPAFPLDALFSSAMSLESPPAHAHKGTHTRGQSVSSSLPPVGSLHARMAAAASSGRRERTLTGNASPGSKFAGASFQHAPDAMVLPKPMFSMSGRFGMLGSGSSSSDESSSSSGEEQVVDLGAESTDDEEVAFFN